MLSSVTIAELLFGIAALLGGKRKNRASRDTSPYAAAGVTVINPWLTDATEAG